MNDKKLKNSDDNFNDIDLNEVFNDFYEKPQELSKTKINHDDLIEFNENDCTEPKILIRKRIKPKKKIHSKQTTMYDYASTISYKNKHFYSSLDNTISTKTITKGQKRSLTDSDQSLKKAKINDNNLNNLSSPSPDFIDKLLQYLDKRSRNISDENSS